METARLLRFTAYVTPSSRRRQRNTLAYEPLPSRPSVAKSDRNREIRRGDDPLGMVSVRERPPPAAPAAPAST